MTPPAGQPAGSLLEDAEERLVGTLDRDPALGSVAGHPDRDNDLVFADIDRGAPLIENLHAVPPFPEPADQDTHAARGAPTMI